MESGAHEQHKTENSSHYNHSGWLSWSTLKTEPLYEWQISHLDVVWRPHTIAWFAMLMNAQLPKYNSRFADPFSSGINALAQTDWNHQNNYLNAPFRMHSGVLDIIIGQRAGATVIAPEWVVQPCHFFLMEPRVVVPTRVPQRAFQMFPTVEHLWKSKWKGYAWRISVRHIWINFDGHKCL